jgi:hypothetical protein
MRIIRSVEVQTPKGGFYKVGLICIGKDTPVSYIQQRQVESQSGDVYTAYDVYDFNDEVMVTIENCPVIVMFETEADSR